MRANVLGLVGTVGVWALACGQTATGREPTAVVECPAAVGEASSLTVDNFEDGDLTVDSANNLTGSWYVNNDGTGEQTPAPGQEVGRLIADSGSPQSAGHALHTSGLGFEGWGAFAAARLNAVRGRACRYDLSGYSGMRFEARGSGSMRMNLGTVETTPLGDGGECAGDACSDYGSSVLIDAEWRSVDVPFAELTQPRWADAAPFEPAHALRISFWSERGDFDFWFDDVRFYE